MDDSANNRPSGRRGAELAAAPTDRLPAMVGVRGARIAVIAVAAASLWAVPGAIARPATTFGCDTPKCVTFYGPNVPSQSLGTIIRHNGFTVTWRTMIRTQMIVSVTVGPRQARALHLFPAPDGLGIGQAAMTKPKGRYKLFVPLDLGWAGVQGDGVKRVTINMIYSQTQTNGPTAGSSGGGQDHVTFNRHGSVIDDVRGQ
jgi:hypothetical protein